MVVAEPGDEARQALIDRRRRLEAEIARGVGDVGIGRGNVAGLKRRKLDHGFAPKRLLDDANEVLELFAAIVADIVNPEGGFSSRIGRRVVETSDDAGNDVVDEGEITPHIAMIENTNRLAGENGLGEEPRRHIGPAPRPIDGKEAQARARYPIEMRVA